MKKLFQYFTLALFGFPMVVQAQIGLKLGAQPGTKNPSAILDLTGTTNQGLLIPRVNLTSTTSYAPLTGTAQAGMLVYNQATAGTAPNNVTPGFYYHNGTVWVRTDGATYTGSTSIALNGTSFERAALSGDVTAAANANSVTVTGLQGRGVVATAPTSGQALAWNGTAWAPATISTTSQNIYTTDGGLTGNRVVTQGANSLTFTGTGNTIFNSGNVGIGTNSPSSNLHVNSTTGEAVFRLTATGTALISQFSGGADNAARTTIGSGAAPNRIVLKNGNGFVGVGTLDPETPFHVTGLTRVRNESTSGFVDLQTGTATNTGYIQFGKPDNTSTGYIGLDLNNMFYQATNGSSHIFGGGNVGIGTSSPTNALHVRQTTFNPSTNDLAAIKVSGSFGGGMVFDEGTSRSAMWALGGHSLYFGSGGTSAGIPTRMVIRDNGNVGIGTALPETPLHIIGLTRVRNQSTSGFVDLQTGTLTNTGFIQFGKPDNTSTGYIGLDLNNMLYQATNGSNHIFGGGNVGIGTVSPTNALQVHQTTFNPGTNDLAAIKVSGAFGGGIVFNEESNRSAMWALGGHSLYFGSGGTSAGIPTRMVIRDNGTVGIGTAFPETPLHVTGLTRVRNESTSGFVDLQTGTATNTGYIQFNKPDNTSTGYIGLDLNNMLYQATNGSNHIFGGGNVGIGTASPQNRLHVEQVGFNPSANDLAAIRVGGSFGGGIVFSEGLNRSSIWSLGGHSLYFGTGGTSTGIPLGMVIAANGNVGIGTATPSAQLHTTGGVRFQGLSGAGTRVVIADDNGVLGTQAMPSSVNLYNSDGALTGARDVNKNGQTLTFSGGGNIQFNGGNVMNVADNASFTWDALGGTSLGFVKKVGFGPMIASGSSGPIVFASSPNSLGDVASASLFERMRITDIGRVGIGTNNPTTNLQVSGGTILSTGTSYDGVSEVIAGHPDYNISNFNGAVVRQYGVSNPTNVAGVDLANAAVFLGQNTSKTVYGSNQNVNTFFISGDQVDAVIDGGSGNMGIGVVNPPVRLSAVGGILAFQDGRYTQGYSTQGSYMTWNDEGLAGGPVQGYTSFVNHRGTGNPGGFIFTRTVGDGSSHFELMRMRGDNGFVGIGTPTPSHPLQMGSGAHVTTSGVWTNASDKRLKRDIVDSKYGLKDVMSLRPVDYVMKQDGSPQVGLLAQEVLNVIPEVVSGKEGDPDKGEILGISYGNLVPVLVKAIQEQQTQINQLKKELELLKSNR